MEATRNPAFHALTFGDLLGQDKGLLMLHAGTQYFRHEASGSCSNLVMREWESYFTKEYGWPVYAEYLHGLMPHDGNLTNADRLRAIERTAPKPETPVPAAAGTAPPSPSVDAKSHIFQGISPRR